MKNALGSCGLGTRQQLWQYAKKNIDRSVYHFQPERLLGNARLWAQKFPGIQPYYAVKCNNHPQILSTLASVGFSFDCASQREIQMAQEVLTQEVPVPTHEVLTPLPPGEYPGESITYQTTESRVDPVSELPRIIFANPVKMPSHLQYAKRSGVQLMTADCPEELEKIAQYSPSAQVLLRIAVDDSQSICKFNSKFGMPPNEDFLVPFFDRIIAINGKHGENDKKGKGEGNEGYEGQATVPRINAVGVSFHVGSGCLSSNSYKDAIEKSRYVFDFAQKYGMRFKILDIGGGFIQKEPLLTDVSETISTCLNRYFGWTPGSTDPLVIAEPGRFMASNVFDLYVQVIGKKTITGGVPPVSGQTGAYPHIKYTVNNSVYGAFNCKIFDYAKFQFDIYKGDSHDHLFMNQNGVWMTDEGTFVPDTLKPSTIFGATCDSLDVIIENTSFPELDVGDHLCFKNMGAYTYSASSEFNGIPSALVWGGSPQNPAE